MALAIGIDLKVAVLPKEKDPADIIQENPEIWKESIKKSEHIIEYLLEVFKENAKDKRALGIKVREEILPYVVMIENKIDQSHFIKKLSEELDVNEKILFEETGKIDISDRKESLTPDIEEGLLYSRKDEIEKRFLGIILWQKNKNDKVIKDFLKEIKEIRGYDLMKKYNAEEKSNFQTMAEILFGGSENIEKEIKELTLNYREDYLKEKLVEEMAKIKQSEKEKNEKKLQTLLKNYQETSNKLEEIKKSRS